MSGKDELGLKCKVDVFPTFLFYHEGKLVGKVIGAKPEKLDEQIQLLLIA